MIIEKTEPIEIDPTYVEVDIRIESVNNGKYKGFIQTNKHRPLPFSVSPSEADVQEINTQLQNAIQGIAANTDIDDGYNGSFSELIDMGRYAFVEIFSDHALRKIISNAFGAGTTLTISTDSFFIPWELLYDGPLQAEGELSHFWGMQRIVSRNLLSNDISSYEGLKPPIHHYPPRIGTIIYEGPDLGYDFEKELADFNDLAKKKHIELIPLRALDPKNHFDEVEYFKDFLSENELHVLHFACHAGEGPTRSDSYLLISHDFPIRIKDFKGHECAVKNFPLVILNACLTGTTNPLSAISNWATLFWKHGARGVLATEFEVPDQFAAAFIRQLYSLLLSGEPIGKALLMTRRYFWDFKKNQGNPLGLAYALYSPVSLRIVDREALVANQ
jgi:hypothetical protein